MSCIIEKSLDALEQNNSVIPSFAASNRGPDVPLFQMKDLFDFLFQNWSVSSASNYFTWVCVNYHQINLKILLVVSPDAVSRTIFVLCNDGRTYDIIKPFVHA